MCWPHRVGVSVSPCFYCCFYFRVNCINRAEALIGDCTDHKSSQYISNSRLVFEERGNLKYLEKNLSKQTTELTNTTHMHCQLSELNPSHIGGSNETVPGKLML